MRRFLYKVPQAATLAISLLMFRVEPAGAQRILSEGIKDLATQIATNVVKEQKHRIAVVPFRELDGRASVLGTFVAEELVTNLFVLGGLEIVERTMLDKVLAELRLDQTGLIDPETAKKVGRIAGVDAIVTGSITELQSYVALNARLIDARTGRIFAAAQARIVKDDDLRKIMGMLASAPTETAKSPSPTGETERAPSSKVTRQQQVKRLAPVDISLEKCEHWGGGLSCRMLLKNTGSAAANIALGDRSSFAYDERGNEYRLEQATLGSQRWKSEQFGAIRLEPGIPVAAKFQFAGLPESARQGPLRLVLAVVQVAGPQAFLGPNPRWQRIVFEDVPFE